MVVTQELQQRFKIDDIVIADKVPILAAALDPRYLHLPFLSARQRSIATGVIKEKCQQILQEKESAETGESEGCSNEVNEGCGPPSKRKKRETALSFLMGEDESENCTHSAEDYYFNNLFDRQ